MIISLDHWVRQGVEPPPSSHPKLSDGTLVQQAKIKFPPLPNVNFPIHVPGGMRIDLPGPISALPFLVPNVDADGNDVGGIRLPEQAVPLGSYTDSAFRGEKMGATDTLIAMTGSYIPFAKTKAERQASGDPRLSIEERYTSRADYQKKVEEYANRMVAQHYLLAEHVKPIVDKAGEHWDWTMGQKSAMPTGTR